MTSALIQEEDVVDRQIQSFNTNKKLVLAQFLNSFVSNVAGDVLGHPLDTIRVSLNFLKILTHFDYRLENRSKLNESVLLNSLSNFLD